MVCSVVSRFTDPKIEVQAPYDISNPDRSVIYCDIPYTYLLPPVVYNILLCIACAYQAFKTRKLPDNFNESKFIAMTMYTTVVAWIAVLSAYLTIPGQYYKVVPLCIALMVNATITNCFLFIPRLYALYWVEKGRLNLRSMSISTTSFSGDGKNQPLDRKVSHSRDSVTTSQTTATVLANGDQKGDESVANSNDSGAVMLSYLDSEYEVDM